MFGDALENATAESLIISPSVAGLPQGHPLAAAGAPSNQQILDATRTFYAANQDLVDTSATNTQTVGDNDKNFVSKMNSYETSLKDKNLSSETATTAQDGLFGSGDGGLFGPTLDKVKATDLYSTIGIGVSAELVVFVGGIGGLGCAIDITKREGPKGYGYATGELGLKVAANINIQASIFNRIPSNLDNDIFGLTVTVGVGASLTFAPMFVGDGKGGLEILGYSVSLGVGAGGGVSVYGGHLWTFG